MSIRTRRHLLFAGLALAFSLPALAHDESGENEKITPLQEHALPDVPGKKGLMVEVSYKPGQVSIPHLHQGAVFAYVLEGAVVSQLQGQQPVTYKAGDSWYEAANTPHLISRNASNSKPAKLLVWLLLDEKAPPLVPLKK